MSVSTQKSQAEDSQDISPSQVKKLTWFDIVSAIGIPLALAVLTGTQIWIAQLNRQQDLDVAQLNRQQDLDIANKNREQDQRIANDGLQHQIMSKYLEDMKSLIFDKGLLKADTPDVESVARAITLNTARQLDPERKGQLLKFLYEADLVGHCQLDKAGQISSCADSIVSLQGVRLNDLMLESPAIPLARIDLQGASLTNAKLPGITLIRAEMRKATLTGADLSKAALTDAQLENAILIDSMLSGALLIRANLKGANLQGANLQNADLQGADLRDADLTGAILQGVKLKNAKYNTKTRFPEEFTPEGQGMQFCLPGELTDLAKQCAPS